MSRSSHHPSRRQMLYAGGLASLALSLDVRFAARAFAAGTATPGRIVAAGGVVTEIIHALGRGERLVGVDSTSLYPSSALNSAANIGYVRALSAEGILSLRPDHLIAIESAGPPDVLKLIGEAGIAVTTIPEDLSEAGVAGRIRKVGAVIGEAPAAEALAGAVTQKFTSLANDRAAMLRQHRPKRILFILSMQNGRIMVGGRNTSADAIVTLAGGINAADAVEGFKPLSDEGLITAAPDVILMMQRGPQPANPDEVFAHPALALVPAARSRAMVSMDGLYLLGFGPRTPDAARDLMTAIYPDQRTRAAMPASGVTGIRQP